MSRRLQVKKLHERFNVNLFLREFNFRYHTDFKVVEEPDPPEAIIQSKGSTRWVEVTTAYLSDEYATDLHSYATKGEKHKPRSRALIVTRMSSLQKSLSESLKISLRNQLTSLFLQSMRMDIL